MNHPDAMIVFRLSLFRADPAQHTPESSLNPVERHMYDIFGVAVKETSPSAAGHTTLAPGIGGGRSRIAALRDLY